MVAGLGAAYGRDVTTGDFRGRYARGLLLALAAGSAVWLVGWSGYLAHSLPDQHDTSAWRVAWVGFDVALLCCFGAGAVLGWRRRRAAVPLLVSTAVLLCCDAWFDVLLDWSGPDSGTSLALAVGAELPVAGWLLLRARRVLVGRTAPKRVTMREIDDVLSSPLCRRVLDALGDHRPVTTEAVAEAVGVPAGEARAALDLLRGYGHVETDRAGRWRTRPVNLHMPELAEIDPADRDRYRAFMDAKYDHELRLLTEAARHRYELGGWGKGSRGGAHLTEAELARFYEEYLELLLRYSLLHERPAPGTRAVALRFYAFPQSIAAASRPAVAAAAGRPHPNFCQ